MNDNNQNNGRLIITEDESTIRLFVMNNLKKDIIKKIYQHDEDNYVYIEIVDDEKSIEHNLECLDILNDEAMDQSLNYIFVLA